MGGKDPSGSPQRFRREGRETRWSSQSTVKGIKVLRIGEFFIVQVAKPFEAFRDINKSIDNGSLSSASLGLK